MIQFILNQARKAFREREFIEAISEAIAKHLRQSSSLNAAIDNINSVTESVTQKYKKLGPTGYFLKLAIAAHLEDLAKDEPLVAEGLSKGTPYVEAVLDGLTVDQLLTTGAPLTVLIAEKAKSLV